MRALDFIFQERAEHRGGIDVEEHEDVEDPSVIWITASAHGRELGQVKFYRQGDTVTALNLEVKPEYRGQGIAKIMYDYAKEQGYRVLRSAEQTDAGYQFWEKNRPRQGVWEDSKILDPDVFEDLDGRVIAAVARRVVPSIRARSTPEGYVHLTTKDGLDLMIGCSIADGEIGINIGSTPMVMTSSGPYQGAVTYIISAVYDAAVREYGQPKKQGMLSIDHDASHGAWQHIANKLGLQYAAERIKEQELNEINAPGQLKVDPDLIVRFTNQGWEVLGEGNDQIVLARPGSNTVLKIVGKGSLPRQAEIRRYVEFFRRNQRNPHFPRVGPDRELDWKGQKYYVYTQERLHHLHGDEAILDYLEGLMSDLGHDQTPDLSQVPRGMTPDQVEGLISAVDSMLSTGMGGQYGFDLSNVYNIMQRGNGQLVIVDPFSSLDDLDENFADGENPGRRGLAKRMGVDCKQSVSKLRKIAKNSSGERQRMAHWCANMKARRTDEVKILSKVKGKGSEPSQLPKFGREIRPDQEQQYLGQQVGKYGKYTIWRDWLGGQLSYHLFDPQERRVIVTTFGSQYKNNPDSYIIHGLYAAPGNPVHAHEFYHALIRDLELTLISDRKQSPGGNKVWINLERYPDVEIYGYDTRTGETLNFGARDAEMYAIPSKAVKDRDSKYIANNLRLVATAK